MRTFPRHRGFTLIELITVMAISTILLGIIVVPMFESFKATRTAQAFADAQDKARLLTERLTREISESVGVKDVEGVGGRVSVVVPIPRRGLLDDGTVITVPAAQQWVTVGMNYTKLDIVLPAKVGVRGAGGGFIDPNTGKEDPTLRAPKGQVQLPLAPGTTIRRYWVGLRDPFTNYLNPYDGLLSARSGSRDNLYVLYMAEVEPVVRVAGVPTVNAAFFDVDPADGSGRTPLYNDPDFFLATGAGAGTPVNNDLKADRIRNWLNKAQIVTELSRYDMIQPIYDKSSQVVKLNDSGGGVYSPRVTPLIQFRPSHVDGDSSDAAMTMPLGAETEGADQLGSETYVGKYGAWSSLTVRSYPGNYAPPQPYQIARTELDQLKTFYFDPTTGVADTTAGSGVELFNISAYLDLAKRKYLGDATARYPFTQSTSVAASTNPGASVFKPFSVNQEKGRISSSFAIADHGNVAQNPNAAANLFAPNDFNPNNLPQIAAQSTTASGWAVTDSALTPITDPAVAAGTFDVAPFYDAAFDRFNINRVFNKVWADAQAGRNGIPAQFGEVGGAHRFIDLRLVPQGDRTPSPLATYPNASIVPSSEEVWGPDQNPGANYGYEVRYRRVNKEPGPNEYRINYTNIPEPSAAGYSALGLPVPPATYTVSSFVSAVVQPRYKVGYIQLCSNPEVPIPASMRVRGVASGTTFDVPGRIRVAYRFQFTNATDTVRVDYDTRQLMQILVTIRNYPQSSVPNPQTVTMKATANVKNFIR